MIANFKHTSRDFNRNFIVKIYGNGINKAVGFAGYFKIIGDDALAHKLLQKAADYYEGDVLHCKLRRGIKISFYNA